MPRLFCSRHGIEAEAQSIEEQELYRQEGETVVIVQGRLIHDRWNCDRCNTPLRPGARAYLLSFYPRIFTAGISEYNFSYEQEYFGEVFDRVSVIGSPWHAVTASADRLVKPKKKRSANHPPLLASDLWKG
jgi:hypothetical protein